MSELVPIIFQELEEIRFDDITTEQLLVQDFLRDESQSGSSIMVNHAPFEHKAPIVTVRDEFEFSEDTNSVDDCTCEDFGIVLSGDECETNAAENMPPREACSHPRAIKSNTDPRSFKKTRKRRRENEDSDSTQARSVSAEFMDCKTKNAIDECETIAADKMPIREDCSHPHGIKSNADPRSFKKSRKCRRGHEDSGSTRARSVSVQCMGCKTKNAITRGRHDNIDNNVLASTPNKYYKQLDIIALSEHQTQLQTTCRCGRIRPFVRRRAIKKGTAMTYFAAERCACDPKYADQLRICFCGALFRSKPTMFKCPCFGHPGPGFVRFPEYARYAPRRCFCPHERRHCSCLVSNV